MNSSGGRRILPGLWVTSLGTLSSRVFGLARDISTASLFGLDGGGIMDAFVVAFRIPNLFRRLLGEGALAASYLPALVHHLERDRQSAWRLASVVTFWLAIVLAGIVLVGEAVCGLLWLLGPHSTTPGPLLGLSAAILPYLWFICLAAQLSTTLQALSHFNVPAFAPMLLNLCWIAGAWWIAPRVSDDPLQQAYVLAACVLVSGFLQLAVQWPVLRALGFRFDYDWPAARQGFWQVTHGVVPVMFGVAVTQINTMMDSVLAISLASPREGQPIDWLGGHFDYPLRTGAAAAIYIGERFYQFPVGVLGVAFSTVIFPLLSRHAARRNRLGLASDLSWGLRLVWFLTVPASIGLILMSGPVARLLYEHGRFTSSDAARAARMIACYGSGVWAYCASPVIIRGYYALNDRATPVRIGLLAVALNLTLNLTLVWPLAEPGLAVATSVAAAVQVALLAALFSGRHSALPWSPLFLSVLKTALACAAMAVLVVVLLVVVPGQPTKPLEAARIAGVTIAGVITFLLAARSLKMPELGLLAGSRAVSMN